jgi:hypothetical protein
MALSTPHFRGGKTSYYRCNLGKRLRIRGAVNVACPPDVVVPAEQINSVMHVRSPVLFRGANLAPSPVSPLGSVPTMCSSCCVTFSRASFGIYLRPMTWLRRIVAPSIGTIAGSRPRRYTWQTGCLRRSAISPSTANSCEPVSGCLRTTVDPCCRWMSSLLGLLPSGRTSRWTWSHWADALWERIDGVRVGVLDTTLEGSFRRLSDFRPVNCTGQFSAAA